MIIWGNHSSTQYPDISYSEVTGSQVKDIINQEWYEGTFIPTVQQRGAAIIKARGASSAASAASAAVDHMRNWALGSAENDWVSMGVYSDGSYGIEKGLIYSFPVTCKNGQHQIIQDLPISDFSKEKMLITEQELKEEMASIKHLLP
jgi:malate dehydrogenase